MFFLVLVAWAILALLVFQELLALVLVVLAHPTNRHELVNRQFLFGRWLTHNHDQGGILL